MTGTEGADYRANTQMPTSHVTTSAQIAVSNKEKKQRKSDLLRMKKKTRSQDRGKSNIGKKSPFACHLSSVNRHPSSDASECDVRWLVKYVRRGFPDWSLSSICRGVRSVGKGIWAAFVICYSRFIAISPEGFFQWRTSVRLFTLYGCISEFTPASTILFLQPKYSNAT